MDSPFEARELVGLLADEDRRRVFAALVLGATDASEAFAAAARAEATRAPRSQEHEDEPEDVAKVLRAFVRNGRLMSIPASKSKRLVLLDWLVQRFEPGRRYSENMVNLILAQVHPDTASLRRYLVDEGMLDREAGEYWRSGGTFAPDSEET